MSLLPAHGARRVPAVLPEDRERKSGRVAHVAAEAAAGGVAPQECRPAHRRAVVRYRVVVLVESRGRVERNLPRIRGDVADSSFDRELELRSEIIGVFRQRPWSRSEAKPESDGRNDPVPRAPARKIEVDAEVEEIPSAILFTERTLVRWQGGIEGQAVGVNALEPRKEVRRSGDGHVVPDPKSWPAARGRPELVLLGREIATEERYALGFGDVVKRTVLGRVSHHDLSGKE